MLYQVNTYSIIYFVGESAYKSTKPGHTSNNGIPAQQSTKPGHSSNNGIPAHLSIPGNSKSDSKRALERSNSLPDGINSPVQLRHTSSRSRKKAQNLRNSVAITSSDYYNQRRPQISQLAVVQQTHSPQRSVTSPLHPITEHDSDDDYYPLSRRDRRSSLIIDLHDLNGLQMTDSRLFRYRSTSSLEPTTSRPTTPQATNPQISKLKRNSSLTSSTSSISRAGSMSSLCDGACTPPPGTPPTRRRPFSVLKMSSQAIPLSSSTENQFLPLYLNPESGFVYMFEEGYYIPLSPENIQTLQNSARVSVTQPPIPVSMVTTIEYFDGALVT